MELSMKLSEVRRGRLLSQRELASRSGVAVATINRIERGLVSPALVTIRKLCEVLGVEPLEVDEFRDAIRGNELAPVSV
jgi:transcriptional regulator with XRE-family HTH domain